LRTVRSSTATRLETFRVANGIKPAHLYLAARISRSYLARLRSGKIEPTRPRMLAIRDACSRLLAREVRLAEVFDLGDAVTLVTAADGNRFAEEWYRGDITEACGAAGLLRWPDEDSRTMTEAQEHFHDVMDEVCLRVFDRVRASISAAFVEIANDVLARERSR